MSVYPTRRIVRIAVAVILLFALSELSLSASAATASPGHVSTDASAAKKKKKKKKCKKARSQRSTGQASAAKKRKKCRSKKKPTTGPGTGGGGGGGGTPQDPVATFTNALQGSLLQRYYSTQFTSGSARFDFCQGTFKYYSEHSSEYTAGSTSAQGTWSVTSAKLTEQGTAGQGTVAYTSNNPDWPPGTVTISLVGQNQAFIGETEYHRTPGAASC